MPGTREGRQVDVRIPVSTPPSRRPARVAFAALALLVAAACAPSRDGVLIAAAGNWDAGYGEMNKRGIDLAVEQINREGGVLGRPLRVAMRNDRGDGARAVSIAAEFLGNPDIVAVVGHVNSGTMVAAARVYDEGLPAVSTTASTPDLTGISRWVFRVISSDSVNGLDLARFAGSRGFRRAAILYENNAYGRGLAQSFERNFGGTVVASDPVPSERTGDFEPFVTWLASRTPDVVFVAGTEESGLAILREARRQHLSSAFLGGDGWTGVVADTSLSEGVFVGAPFSPQDPRDEVQRFTVAFRQRYGMEPDGNAALAYDATRLVARAVTDGGASREGVRRWLASRTRENAFAGVTGSIAFQSTGDVIGKGYVMTQVHRGALVVARAPEEARDRAPRAFPEHPAATADQLRRAGGALLHRRHGRSVGDRADVGGDCRDAGVGAGGCAALGAPLRRGDGGTGGGAALPGDARLALAGGLPRTSARGARSTA